MFAASYAESRRVFLAAAREQRARVDTLADDEETAAGLATDIAWCGPRDAAHVVLHISGLHGVEGYVGAAIQCDWLQRPDELPPQTAVALVHAVNPFGMAQFRRVNRDNVDLNRNALAVGESYCGAAPAYDALGELINPTQPPSRPSLFYIRAAVAVARFGFQAVKQAIAEGQYEHPRGLFFGGAALAHENQRLLQWCRDQLPSAERISTIDVHSGLGAWGLDVLLCDLESSSEEFQQLREHVGERLAPLQPTGVAYKIRGPLLSELATTAPAARWIRLGQEFGTYNPFRVLRALINENAWRQWGTGAIDHWSIQQMSEAFCPKSRAWRDRIVTRGRELLRQLVTS